MSPITHFVKAAGHEIHVAEWGRGNAETAILWHGLARTGADFEPLAAELAKEWRLLVPDTLGRGLTALTEITLDRQGNQEALAFEARVVADPAVQQCYRVSPGPDFVLVVHVADMPAYLALAQRLFTSDANVRNVKSFFSIHRAKFAPRVLLGAF